MVYIGILIENFRNISDKLKRQFLKAKGAREITGNPSDIYLLTPPPSQLFNYHDLIQKPNNEEQQQCEPEALKLAASVRHAGKASLYDFKCRSSYIFSKPPQRKRGHFPRPIAHQ